MEFIVILTHFEQLEYEDSFQTYQIWEGVRCHFAYDSYDWSTHGPKSNLKFANYCQHKHRWHYLKLHRRFKGQFPQLFNHLAANFAANPKFHITGALSDKAFKIAAEHRATFDDIHLNFREWVMVYLPMIMLEQNVTSFMELIRTRDFDEPWLLGACNSEQMPLWVAMTFDAMLSYRVKYNIAYPDHFVWQQNSKLLFKLGIIYPFDKQDVSVLRAWFVQYLKEKGLN